METEYNVDGTDRGDNLAVGGALEMFVENEDVMQMINNVSEIYEDERAFEKSLETLSFIMDKYLEQPHLLDPYLEKMLECVVKIVRNDNVPMSLKNKAFKYARLIIKVRGYKVVIRHLPHEVADLEPVLSMLESIGVKDIENWESSYCLLLWMSIIVKIPFEMSRLDAGERDNTVLRRILGVCKTYLYGSTALSAAAAYLTSAFLTRVDVVKQCLQDFLDWALEALVASSLMTSEEEHKFVCTLTALASLLKHGKREDFLPHALRILQKILSAKYKTSKNSLLRRYAVKVIQRIGLTLLKPKVASWRYDRGSRSLAENLKGDAPVAKQAKTSELPDEDFEVPDEIEEVIEELMQGLKDPETAIRWSAAKGIGRVTGRLPCELANEVVTSVFEILNPREGDGAWHGGCLALAELGRRGLLLPIHLPQVLPLLLQALVFEDSRGYYSIGDHVRDAACYVAWSFARAYDPMVLKPYVNTIASGLLVVALFDREIKCRKAAAAAYQEHVGRQGTFPHGIEIVTTADYYSVAIRRNAYLNVAVFVGGFPEYTIPLITHLLEKKVNHWDVAVRELSASALCNLTPLALDYVRKVVLPELLVKTKSSDLNCRHGGTLATAEVLHVLAINNVKIPDDVLNELKSLMPFYRERFYFNGMGGEIQRQAFCHLIRKCAEAELPFAGQEFLSDWQLLLDECLFYEVPVVRQKGAAALRPFLNTFYTNISEATCNELIDRYITEITSNNQTSRLGAAAALSSLPKFIMLPRLPDVVAAFLDAMRITTHTAKWVESRRDAIVALINVINSVGVSELGGDSRQDWDTSVATNVGSKTMLLPETGCTLVHLVLAAFNVCLHEYTIDSRGDIGAWVREAAISGIEKLILAIAAWDPSFLAPYMLGEIMGGILQQTLERINRTRGLAGKVFTSLLHYSSPELSIPHRDALLKILPRDEKEVMWSKEAEAFPRFVRIVKFPAYSKFVLEGLIMSIGDLTESLVKHSSASLFSFLKEVDFTERYRICQVILDIFASNLHDNRVIIPLLSFLDRLLGSGVVRDVLEDSDGHFAAELLRLGKAEMSGSKDYKKISGSMDLFCQLVQVEGTISKRALCQMSVFLNNRLIAVRKSAATKLYECLLVYGDISWVPEEQLDDVMTLLSDTNWEQELEIIRPIRNKLCELMNVPVPTMMIKSQ